MTKSRILLFFIIVIAATSIYMLPRYVVNTTNKEVNNNKVGIEQKADAIIPGLRDQVLQNPLSMSIHLESQTH